MQITTDDCLSQGVKRRYFITPAWTVVKTDSIFSLPVQVMQKLGKADETRDAAFEEMVANFNKQTVSSSSSSSLKEPFLIIMHFPTPRGQCFTLSQ